MTDEDEDNRRGGRCSHRRCPPDDCQMLKPDALVPDDADRAYALQLIAEGYFSVSTRYRHLQKGEFSFHNPTEISLSVKQWKAWRAAGGPIEAEKRAGRSTEEIKSLHEIRKKIAR